MFWVYSIESQQNFPCYDRKSKQGRGLNSSKFQQDDQRFCGVCYFMNNYGENTVKHTSEMKLYMILPTLEKFSCWNQTIIIM